MIRIRNIILLHLVSIFFTANIFGQSLEAPKNDLTKLFELCKSNKYEEAASLIAYDGNDEQRKMKDANNPGVKEELDYVKRICKKIKAYISLSSEYVFGGSTSSNQGGNNITTIQVNFLSGNQNLLIDFNFIKSGSKYLLISVE